MRSNEHIIHFPKQRHFIKRFFFKYIKYSTANSIVLKYFY